MDDRSELQEELQKLEQQFGSNLLEEEIGKFLKKPPGRPRAKDGHALNFVADLLVSGRAENLHQAASQVAEAVGHGEGKTANSVKSYRKRLERKFGYREQELKRAAVRRAPERMRQYVIEFLRRAPSGITAQYDLYKQLREEGASILELAAADEAYKFVTDLGRTSSRHVSMGEGLTKEGRDALTRVVEQQFGSDKPALKTEDQRAAELAYLQRVGSETASYARRAH